jgi:NAD(P) transhydrogenase subunit beta
VTLLGALIGAVSLSGSLIAWAKLDGVIKRPLRIKGQQAINGTVMAATLAVGGWIVCASAGLVDPVIGHAGVDLRVLRLRAVFGVLMTLPIGGADMPVVISIYNAFTGLAVGLEGYVLQNPALMIAGMVVGAAGLLLTLLMAKRDEPLGRQRRVHALRRRAGRAQAGRDQGQPQADGARRRRHRDALRRAR